MLGVAVFGSLFVDMGQIHGILLVMLLVLDRYSFVGYNGLVLQDMVCIGTMTPDEASEVIEMSLSILERRKSLVELQRTRSKSSIDGKG